VISFTSYQAPPAQVGQPPIPTITVNNLASFGGTYTSNTGPIPASAFRCTPQNPPQPPSLLQPLATQGRVGDDILLTNVLSFEIQATWAPAPQAFITYPSPAQPTNFIPIRGPRAFTNTTGNPNTDYPFDHLPNVNINPFLPAHMFDTWYTAGAGTPNAWNNFNALYNPQLKLPQNPNLIPMPIRITGLQITIRIYDPKTNQARQNTWRIAM
jgi:hypothetical protein